MEPLLPTSGKAELADLSVKIFQKSGELKASLPSKAVRQEISRLVCEMNSYYSNLIEGHKTLPRDIEKALLSRTQKSGHSGAKLSYGGGVRERDKRSLV